MTLRTNCNHNPYVHTIPSRGHCPHTYCCASSELLKIRDFSVCCHPVKPAWDKPNRQCGSTTLTIDLADSRYARHPAHTRSTHARSFKPGHRGGGERDRTDDPLLAKQVLSQLSYTPSGTSQAPSGRTPTGHPEVLVGLVGFEPTTPALSRRCSNRLSYRPAS